MINCVVHSPVVTYFHYVPLFSRILSRRMVSIFISTLCTIQILHESYHLHRYQKSGRKRTGPTVNITEKNWTWRWRRLIRNPRHTVRDLKSTFSLTCFLFRDRCGTQSKHFVQPKFDVQFFMVCFHFRKVGKLYNLNLKSEFSIASLQFQIWIERHLASTLTRWCDVIENNNIVFRIKLWIL